MPALRNSNPTPKPGPALVAVGNHKGQTTLPLSRPFTLIGSTASARLYLPSKSVSRCHAVIINTGNSLYVRDLASRTHTRINGQVVAEADLREGDVLQVGPYTFRFSDPTAVQEATSGQAPAPTAPDAALEVDGLDEPLPLGVRSTLIGRRETADISLTESSASSAHALLFVAEGRHVLRDLNSRTGTFVNGTKVHDHPLSPGDEIRVGETVFRYVRRGAAGAGEAAAPAAVARGPALEAEAPLSASRESDAPAPTAIAEAPAAGSAPTSGQAPEVTDFGAIAVELAPEPPEEQRTRSSNETKMEPGGNDGNAVGLLEMGETNRETVAKSDASDLVISPGGALEQPPELRAENDTAQLEAATAAPAAPGPSAEEPFNLDQLDRDSPELPALADEATPAAEDETQRAEPPQAAPLEPPAQPAQPSPKPKGGRWGRNAAPPGKSPTTDRRPRPRNPFDVLGAADDLEPLPELSPDLPPPPAPGSLPGPFPSKE